MNSAAETLPVREFALTLSFRRALRFVRVLRIEPVSTLKPKSRVRSLRRLPIFFGILSESEFESASKKDRNWRSPMREEIAPERPARERETEMTRPLELHSTPLKAHAEVVVFQLERKLFGSLVNEALIASRASRSEVKAPGSKSNARTAATERTSNNRCFAIGVPPKRVVCHTPMHSMCWK